MEILGARPAWSVSGSEQLLTLDAVEAELARLGTVRLDYLAGLDQSGHAKELGAHDTVELLAVRHNLDPRDVRRNLTLAKNLPKYPAVSAALPNPTSDFDPTADSATDPDDKTGSDLDRDGDVESGAEAATDADADADADAAADGDGDGDGDGDLDSETASASETDTESESGGESGSGGEARWVLRPAQAQVIIGALEKLPDTVPVADIDVAERELVKLARHLNPVELRKTAKHVCDLLDTDGPEPAEDKAYDREALWLRNADNGVKFGGYLANENAELLRAMIHAGAKPHKTIDGELDPRSRDKRQADALTTVLNTAAAAAASDGFVPGGGPKAHITLTADLEDLRSGAGGAGIGDLVYGDGLSAAAIRRLACDGQVTPLILGKNSVPLDVGWTKRFVTGHIRKALNFRDRGCVVCGAPPISCEAHHLIHWIDGGATKLCNLVLLCKRHHIALHAGSWTITITHNGVVQVERPTWADPDPTTRIRYRPPPAPPPPGTPASAGSAGSTGSTGSTGDCPGSTTAPAAAAFDPWADTPTDPATHTAADTTTAGSITPTAAAAFDPWGDLPGDALADTTTAGSTTPADAAAFDPWDDLPAAG